MGRLGAKIEQGDKEELFELAEQHFPSNEEFLNSIGMSKSNFNAHRNGDSEVMGLDNLYELVKVVNTAQPIFKDSEPEEFEGSTWGDSIEVKDAVQELALGHFETEELEQIFDKSAPQVKKYKNNNGKYVPAEGFETAFQRMKQELDSYVELSIDIVDIETYNSGFAETQVLAESWDEEDLLRKVDRLDLRREEGKVNNSENVKLEELDEGDGKISRLEDLQRVFEEHPPARGRAVQAVPAIERMKKKSYSKAEDAYEGHLYSLLCDSGHLEPWGGKDNTTCRTVASDEELDIVKDVVAAYTQREVIGSYDEKDKRYSRKKYSDEDLVNAVQDVAERLGYTPTSTQVNNLAEPGYSSLFRFGGYNNLLFRAGMSPNWEDYGDDELLEILSHEYVDNDFTAPQPADIKKSDIGPKPQTYKRRFGSWEKALEEADIPLIGDMLSGEDYFTEPVLDMTYQEPVHLPTEGIRSD